MTMAVGKQPTQSSAVPTMAVGKQPTVSGLTMAVGKQPTVSSVPQLAGTGLDGTSVVTEPSPVTNHAPGGSNLPFDDRMARSTSPWVPVLARGWAQHYDVARRRLGPQMFHFMFNPHQIAVSYAEDSSGRAAANSNMGVAQGSGAPGPSFIAFGFDLLFDRTYEVAYNKDKLGAMRDVKALENMLGVSQGTPYLNKGLICRWVLGRDVVVYGYVAGFNVNYARFNQDMIPMYADMHIDLRHFPAPGQDLLQVMNHRGHGAPKPPPPTRKRKPPHRHGRRRR